MEFTLDVLPSDIIRTIHIKLDFPSQVNLMCVSKNFKCYPVTNLIDNVPIIVTDNFLQLYSYMDRLLIDETPIFNINYLLNLRILHIYDDCNIDNDTIKLLTKLTTLSVYVNSEITNVNCLTNLQTLYVGYCTEINYDSFKSLTNLTELHINNRKITTLNDLVHLRTLSISCCNIDESGIKLLTNLVELDISGNNMMANINHLINLQALYIKVYDMFPCRINNYGISGLTNLIHLNVNGNNNITDINNLINLRILYANGNSGIDNNGIASLTNLTSLYCTNNHKIRGLDHIKIDK